MLIQLRALWSWASGIGIHENLPVAERPKVRLLNQLLIGTIPVHLLIIVQDFLQRDGPGVLITLVPLSITLLTFFLQAQRWYTFARAFVIIFLALTMVSLSYLYGRDLGGEYALLVMLVGVVILFDNQLWWQIGLYGILFGAYECIRWLYFYHDPTLIDQLNPSTNHWVFLACMMGCFIIGRIFIQHRTQMEGQMAAVLHDLGQKNHELAQANADLERFAFVASHDLKTPLRNINNFLGLIERRLPADSQVELFEYLQIASNNARHMFFLIEDILQYARLDSQSEFQKIDLNLIARRAMRHLANFIEEKKAKIEVENLGYIMGYEPQLELLYQNLIENAIKYNESETPSVTISAEQNGNRLILSFKDNGIGIAKHYQSKIFDMFYRLHTQDRYTGTGIGLAICQKIIEKHHGKITLESEYGHGSVFYLDFPMLEGEDVL